MVTGLAQPLLECKSYAFAKNVPTRAFVASLMPALHFSKRYASPCNLSTFGRCARDAKSMPADMYAKVLPLAIAGPQRAL